MVAEHVAGCLVEALVAERKCANGVVGVLESLPDSRVGVERNAVVIWPRWWGRVCLVVLVGRRRDPGGGCAEWLYGFTPPVWWVWDLSRRWHKLVELERYAERPHGGAIVVGDAGEVRACREGVSAVLAVSVGAGRPGGRPEGRCGVCELLVWCWSELVGGGRN